MSKEPRLPAAQACAPAGGPWLSGALACSPALACFVPSSRELGIRRVTGWVLREPRTPTRVPEIYSQPWPVVVPALLGQRACYETAPLPLAEPGLLRDQATLYAS